MKTIKIFLRNFANLFRKPRTVVYPVEKIIIPEDSRGLIHMKLNLDTLDLICNGCGKCIEVCPMDCIEIIKDRKTDGKTIVKEFYIDFGKCIFCGNCVEKCEPGALEMTYRHQAADYRRRSLIFGKENLIRQSDYKIRKFWIK